MTEGIRESGGPGLVYILDDSRLFLARAEQAFRDVGLRVVSFTSVMEALARVRTTPPDLLLVDVHMPFLDGQKVVEQLKRNPRTAHLPVVFCSAMDKNELCILAAEAGAADYVHKSTEMEALARRVSELVERHRSPRPGRPAPEP